MWHSGEPLKDCNLDFVSQLQIRNQSIYLEPPLEHARKRWLDQFQNWVNIVILLPRIRVFQYERELTDGIPSFVSSNYISILSKIQPQEYIRCYKIIESMYTLVSDYVQEWFQYQVLWDIEPSYVFDLLGDDLESWSDALLQIKKHRSTFDTSKTCKQFQGIRIDFENIQQKVNAQYDQWQRDLVSKFSSILLQQCQKFFAGVRIARQSLEHPLGFNTDEMITFLVILQDLNIKRSEWDLQLQQLIKGQKLLERQRFHFPSDWVYIDQLVGEWSSFKDILSRKAKQMDSQIELLRERVILEHNAIVVKNSELTVDWHQKKPIQGYLSPAASLHLLNEYQHKCQSIERVFDLVIKATNVLDLPVPAKVSLANTMEELGDLKQVWTKLQDIWKQLEQIQLIKWTSNECWTVKSQLENLIENLKNIPNQIRQYSPFETVHERIQVTIKKHVRISILKSEALRERHWDRVLSILGLSLSKLGDISVGMFWESAKFQENMKSIEEIVALAQGELAFEEYLKTARNMWSSYNFEFAAYQKKCRLVKGWDDLFSKTEETLTAISAMKHSIHFKSFKDEANHLEESLSKLYSLLIVWAQVQRQWVYLEGIFSGNQDIMQVLPIESNRFVSVDAEFLNMLRKVYKSPLVFDVINIPNIHKSMDRLSDLLSSIQKSLGEYLERERKSFPRFYFVGDEDLLEILGNARNMPRIIPHFKKMFGFSSIQIIDDQIFAVSSKEGEVVTLHRRIKCGPSNRIHEWLSQLEMQSKESLRLYLLDACQSEASNYFTKEVDQSTIIEWIIAYPAQILLLSIQCNWTLSVESSLAKNGLDSLLQFIEKNIRLFANLVVTSLTIIMRKKCESLITELVHQRDVVRSLLEDNTQHMDNFLWLSQMRFYLDLDTSVSYSSCLQIKIADTSFYYGFEYLGIQDRLVQTPLTDRCYMTLAQALHHRLGGSPFGPAGTGKTETVKAMAAQIGRFCLVFCCDEHFDFQSIGRIFMGLSQVGAWGCFDEFNRLDEKILSAVSQQIQTIQFGLLTASPIELVGNSVTVHKDTGFTFLINLGIFITMNPGYAGRNELPNNLRKLFRSVAMVRYR